ncbi:glycosyltransferase family 4 protein [Flavobacterium sp. PLA-1-15]|uniref:glycosyltransferase family 4 protein n=1 Tax=Flavobacterium sp. PLA-1-15 TaxID=3380533 RepID=UPI003B78969A
MNDNCKVLIIGLVWPEPDSSAAGLRMIQLIEAFHDYGYEITFACSASESEYMADLSIWQVKCKTIELNCNSFDVFIKDINPDIVLFDRFIIEEQFGWRVALNCPDALRILDTEDLHSLRLSRLNAFKKKKDFEFEHLLTEDIAKREIASILRCDVSLFVSEFEIEILKSLFKIDDTLLYHLPIFVDLNENNAKAWKTFGEKKNFLFIGNFLHEPNWNTVQYLKEEIWPLIRQKMPDAVLNIYGAYPSQKVFQLHNVKEGFHVMGRAEKASEVFKSAKIILAPIRIGAGIKGKLLEGMQFGTPSITTSMGAEGMNGKMDWSGYIADDPIVFAEKAVALYYDEKLWNQANENGINIIKNRYRKELFVSSFMSYIHKVEKEINDHRRKNFIGALLQYHTLKSTEYMSRWIQEKNKK